MFNSWVLPTVKFQVNGRRQPAQVYNPVVARYPARTAIRCFLRIFPRPNEAHSDILPHFGGLGGMRDFARASDRAGPPDPAR
jgi:hypothetical protein